MTTKNQFRKEMISSTGLTLVQFKKEYNGACQIVSSIYQDLARIYKEQAVFLVVDIEKQPAIAEQYGIAEIPTILFFRAGEIVDYVAGLAPKNVMIAKIENALSAI
ncbi:MAG TPA: thioredoxin domain-containing protein [Chitinophagaceae bacterium]|nr:thioredoxin domain-containing protein [Chitinophagaceae bacterium]